MICDLILSFVSFDMVCLAVLTRGECDKTTSFIESSFSFSFVCLFISWWFYFLIASEVNVPYKGHQYSAGTSFSAPQSITGKPMEVLLSGWILLHCMLLVSYIQQYFNTSITVLTNQVWKLLIELFKVPNTGALTVQRVFVKELVNVKAFILGCGLYIHVSRYVPFVPPKKLHSDFQHQ